MLSGKRKVGKTNKRNEERVGGSDRHLQGSRGKEQQVAAPVVKQSGGNQESSQPNSRWTRKNIK